MMNTSDLSYIRVVDFKNIENARINLARMNLLIGGNNSGKSSLIQAIHFFTLIAQACGTVSAYKQSTTVSREELLYVPADDLMSLRHGARITQKHGVTIQYGLRDSNDHESEAQIRVVRGKNANLSVTIDHWSHWNTLADTTRPYSVYVPGLAGISTSEQYLSPRIVQRSATRGDRNSVLRNILWQLHQRRTDWEAFSQALAAVYPRHTIDVACDHETSEHIDVTIWAGKGVRSPLGLAGTGLLQCIQVLAYTYLYQPRLLLLDEPDSHLHPNRQVALLGAVVSWAEEVGSTVIVATHSRHVVNALAATSNVCWFRDGAIQDQTTTTVAGFLTDIGALDGLDRLASGSVATVVLTEDAMGAQPEGPLHVCLSLAGFDMKTTQVLPYSGSSNLDAAIIFSQYIQRMQDGVAVVIHRDGDYLSESELKTCRQRILDSGAHPFITPRNEIESSFINAEHVNSLYPSISVQRAAEPVDAAIVECRDESLRLWSEHSDMAMRNVSQSERKSSWERSTDIAKKFDENPKRYVKGKRALKALQHELRKEIGASVNLIRNSEYVELGDVPTTRSILERAR